MSQLVSHHFFMKNGKDLGGVGGFIVKLTGLVRLSAKFHMHA